MKNNIVFFRELDTNHTFLPAADIPEKLSPQYLMDVIQNNLYFTKKERATVRLNGTETEVNAKFNRNGNCILVDEEMPVFQIFVS